MRAAIETRQSQKEAWDFPGGPVVKNAPAVLASAAHILKLERYRED